jgi:hypothetical protein
MMYDFALAAQAFADFNLEFQPDAMVSPKAAALPGPVYDIVDYRLYSWPGHGIPRASTIQFNEADWMLAEEYDEFIADPGQFLFRRFVPRICGALGGLTQLGSVFDSSSMGSLGLFASFAHPEVTESLDRLVRAGREAGAWLASLSEAHSLMQSLGFPLMYGATSTAPYDYLADKLRGTRGISLDLFRQPEKVIEACDRLTPALLRWTVEQVSSTAPPCVFIPLHKGADGFMSDEQFELFYWPSLRKLTLGLIEEGLIPAFFGEGKLDTRLETIATDLPKGKTVWLLDRTDMVRAKATLGRVAALQGNVPLSLLQTGTADEVNAHCQRLIEQMAPGGGFLLDSGAALHQVKDENLRTMISAAHRYGVY